MSAQSVIQHVRLAMDQAESNVLPALTTIKTYGQLLHMHAGVMMVRKSMPVLVLSVNLVILPVQLAMILGTQIV